MNKNSAADMDSVEGNPTTLRLDNKSKSQIRDLMLWWEVGSISVVIRRALEWAWMFEKLQHMDKKD